MYNKVCISMESRNDKNTLVNGNIFYVSGQMKGETRIVAGP